MTVRVRDEDYFLGDLGWNLPSVGRPRLPVASWIDPVGQISMQVPQAKQSGIILSRFRIAQDIAAISETHNPSLRILVLTTMFNKRQNLDKIIRQQVEDFFRQSLVLESIIHRYVRVLPLDPGH